MVTTRKRLVLESPAKLNLSLEVLGLRSDGYHSVRSVMVPVSLHDTVTFTPGGRKFVFHGGLRAPKDEGNLAWQALTLLTRETGVRRGLEIRVVKRIPIGAGLGGGSSNAATVLRGLDELWELGLGPEKLERLGLELGSDVPFFLRGVTCLAGGRGEELEPLPQKGVLEFVIVVPPFEVSSGWAYDHIPAELTRQGSSTSMIKVALASDRVALLASHLANDLEAGVAARHHEVPQIKKRLLECGALGVSMSGSGPAVFGVAPDAQSADEIAARIERRDWKVIRASSLK